MWQRSHFRFVAVCGRSADNGPINGVGSVTVLQLPFVLEKFSSVRPMLCCRKTGRAGWKSLLYN